MYPGQDTFECDQGHVTKNQPTTVLILLSESFPTNFDVSEIEINTETIINRLRKTKM